MKIIFLSLLALGVCLSFSLNAQSQEKQINPDGITFTILYNDVPLNDSFVGDQGFSCFIEIDDRSFLFDAGRIEEVMAKNTEASGIDCFGTEFIFISHLHSDHTGGLPGFVEQSGRPLLFLPASTPKSQSPKGREYVVSKLEKALPHISDTVHIREPARLNEYMYSTGMFEDRTYEQSLIINTTKGLIILTGCSHPGIVEIVRGAKSQMNSDIYFVMGGFHLVTTDPEQVKTIAGELRGLTKYIAPGHCTGEKAQEIFKDVFKDDYIEIKTGFTFKLSGENE